MAEIAAPRKKTKVNKEIDDIIPDLPDTNLIEIIVTENIENKIDLEAEINDDDDNRNDEYSDVVAEIPVKDEFVYKPVELAKMYPSISECRFSSIVLPINIESAPEILTENKNSLDVVTERITKPVAPLEEWLLPEPLSMSEMKIYYRNMLLENLERLQTEFTNEMQENSHPLAELVEIYQRSVKKLKNIEENLSQSRSDCASKQSVLWTVAEKTGWKEARCRDNAIVKRSYNYDEAILNSDALAKVERSLVGILEESIDEQALLKYEMGLSKAMVEDFLAQVKMQPVATPSGRATALRQCVGVLCRFLRRVPVHADCVRALQEWIVFLGTEITESCAAGDKLYLLWELLHAPAGVAEWAAGLVQTGDDVELSVAALTMLLGSKKNREEMLQAWNPCGASSSSADESAWALVDSEGEDDETVASSWSLLRESDLITFVGQIPIASVFKRILSVDDSRDEYDPTAGCDPNKLLTVMSFCMQLMSTLDSGLNIYHRKRYKALNKRISRLMKHTVQFLTDHLELVLSCSVIPHLDGLFPGDIRLRMLSQYEFVFEYVLKSIVNHRQNGNWQNLVDLPWRLLSPHRKWSFLTLLIDSNQKDIQRDDEWFLTNLQLVIDPAFQDDTIYLLTTMSNMAVECRSMINAEFLLLGTLTRLIFQISYVIPLTRSLFSKVGRDLLSLICVQHPQALSIILNAMKLWHPTVGQMGLFLFRDLPFCLMIPTDAEFKLLSSWLLDNPPSSICNQLARHILSNLNWGFSNTDETCIYLPLSLHQRMANLLISSFKKHTMDIRAGNWFINESIKMVTNLWWNQEANQDQSFHAWCLSLCIRLRLHQSTRPKVVDPTYLQPSSVINTSEWIQAVLDANQERCSHPIAMYIAVSTRKDSQIIDTNILSIILNLVYRQQQYRLSLELLSQIIYCSTTIQTAVLLNADIFMNLWKMLIHADDTYYNMVKNLISKQFPGPVLSCVGNSFCPSLIIGNGEKGHQETLMKFFLNSVTNQINWHTDQSFLWLLDKLLEINTALDLKTGSDEFYIIVKQFTEKQFADANKRSGFAQIFRLGSSFNALINQLAIGNFMWLKSYILEAQALVEDKMEVWKELLQKLFIKKKREPRNIVSALNSVCKHLHLSLSISINNLVIIQTVQVLASCPADHLALIKIVAVFFQRYLGLARVWNDKLIGFGSAGHRLFQDDACLPFLQQARTAILSAKNHHCSQLDSLTQTNASNVNLIDQMQKLNDRLEMFLLWIDEPRLHVEDISVSGLPFQYRPDLLNLARLGSINIDDLNFPRRLLLEQTRQAASLWETRHDLDYRFIRLANSILSKPRVPVASQLLQRFKRQLSNPCICPPDTIQYCHITIPSQALINTTQILEFISAPLSTMYQSAAKHKANKNFLADLDKKYLIGITKQYETQTIKQTLQIPCNKGVQGCSGQATLNMNYQTWTKRNDIAGEMSRNRLDYNKLVDEMIQFSNLDKLVKGVICLQHLIIGLESQLQLAKNEEEFKKVIDCGLALFFYLGRQINPETQNYPPHHCFVSRSMDSIGSKFMPYSKNQATILLKEMISNELLVEVYGPHFCPNVDTSQTANMYLEVIQAFETGKCSQEITSIILIKFQIKQFIDSNPNLTSKLNMSDVLCTAIGYTNPEKSRQLEMDNKMEEIHVNNIIILLSSHLSICLPRIMEKFRSLCDNNKLGIRFWDVVSHCLSENINSNSELVLTIEEIRVEIENIGIWLNKSRFSDPQNKRNGLYCKFGAHAIPILKICGTLLESIIFKLCRSSKENIVSWQEVVEKIWDLFLKIYIPWIQPFFIDEDGGRQTELRLPWRMEDQTHADNVVGLALEHLNSITMNITNNDAQSFFLNCVLIWISNGLLLVKELPAKPYHYTYCNKMNAVKWNLLLPTTDCLKLIIELISRPWISEECKILFIDIASQMQWMTIANIIDGNFIAHMFDLVVVIICKTKFVFKVAAIEKLADTFIDLNWDQLQSSVYRKGMDQLVANLEPKIILCNPSTIEGKIIKLLHHATGCITRSDDNNPQNFDMLISKQTIYVNTVVKLLSVAFSFTQTKNSKGKLSSGDDNQVKLFQLRVSGLFSEIESMLLQISNREISEKMAMSLLAEVIRLFKNPNISSLAIDPVIDWLKESRSSPIILPFLVTLFRCGSQISSIVILAEELIESFILSGNSDGGQASWATINACVRLDIELQQQYWKECVKQNCILCLVQQIFVSLSSANPDQWQPRIVEWLEQIRPQGQINEQSVILIVFFFLQIFLVGVQKSTRPGTPLKNIIQLLLKLSESKTSSGFLGKVGLGKKSNFSFEFRMLCRSLSVFLHAQLPTNNVIRTHPNDPGAITHPDMTVPSRTMGEALPTNKSLQNLEWIKSQRLSKELTANTKSVLENNISFICNPQNCIFDSPNFIRQMCRQMWPDSKLLNLIYF